MDVGRGRVELGAGRGDEGEPARWLAAQEGDALSETAAEAIRGLSPVVLPRAMSTAEDARLRLRVHHLIMWGKLPGRRSWPLKVGLVAAVAGVGAAGILGAVYWRGHEPTPAQGPGHELEHDLEIDRSVTGVALRAPASLGSGAALAPRLAATTASVATPAAATTPEAAPAPALAPAAAVARGSARRVRAVPAPTQPRQGGVAEEDALSLETRLLDQARELLIAQPGRALAVLGEHRRRFPNGQLEAEREFLSIQALVLLGRTAEARQQMHALEVAHPRSSYVGRAARLLDAR